MYQVTSSGSIEATSRPRKNRQNRVRGGRKRSMIGYQSESRYTGGRYRTQSVPSQRCCYRIQVLEAGMEFAARRIQPRRKGPDEAGNGGWWVVQDSNLRPTD